MSEEETIEFTDVMEARARWHQAKAELKRLSDRSGSWCSAEYLVEQEVESAAKKLNDIMRQYIRQELAAIMKVQE